MKVQTSKGTFVIQFQHMPPRILHKSKVESFLKGTVKKIQLDSKGNVFLNEVLAGSYCTIHKNEFKGEVISQGQSYISPNDMYSFNKEIGRKIALTRALKKMHLSKEDRKLFWEAYLNRDNA